MIATTFQAIFLVAELAVYPACVHALQSSQPEAPVHRFSPASSIQGAPTENAPRDLKPGEKIRAEIGGIERHSYIVRSTSANLARILISQQGIDLNISLNTPDGGQRMEEGNPTLPYGTRSISLRFGTYKYYRLDLRPFDEFAMRGKYEISVAFTSTITANDEKRLRAEEKVAEGQRKQSQGEKGLAPAIEAYEQARSIWESIKDNLEEANTCHRIAIAYQSLKKWEQAEKYYNQTLKLRREIADRQGEAYTLNDLAKFYREWPQETPSNDSKEQDSRTKQAHNTYKQAISIFQTVQDLSGEASSLYGIGFLYATRYQMRKALEFYEPALRIRQKIGDHNGEARVLNAMGGANGVLGNNKEALEQHQKAMSGWLKIGDLINEANTNNNIGLIYDDWGDWQKALESYSKAITIYEKLAKRDPQTRLKEARALNNLGCLYIALGEYQQAMRYLEKAIIIFHQINRASDEGTALAWMGYVSLLQGDYQRALKYCEEAYPLQEKEKEPRIEVTLTTMGMSRAALKEYLEAFENYQKALKIQQDPDGGSLIGQGITLDKLGQLRQLMGETESAIQNYGKALEIWRRMGNREGESLTLYNLARAEQARGNLAEADKHIQSAIASVETLRTNVVGQHLRRAYFTAKVGFYELAVDIRMQLNQLYPDRGHSAAAFLAAEQAKARNLMESLVEVHANLREGVDPQLVEREQQLIRLHDSKWQALMTHKSAGGSGAKSSELEKEIDSLRYEIDQVKSEIRRQSPQYAALTQPQPLGPDQIQQEALDDDTLLLEYSLGEDRSYLWLLTKTDLASFVLPGRSEIEGKAKELYRLIKRESIAPEDQYRQAAARLSEMVLGPVAERIKNKRLLIVRDGALQYVPFAVLPIPAITEFKPLIVEHEIIYLPSATTLVVIGREQNRRAPASKQIAVLADPVFDAQDERVNLSGDKATPGKSVKPGKSRQSLAAKEAKPVDKPERISQLSILRDIGLISQNGVISDLPQTGLEAKEILKLIPASEGLMATGFQANLKTALSPELARYRIVHFATHGVLDDKRPELSGLLLSMVNERGRPQDGFLGLNSVYNLKLSAELVVLSACQTALGKDVKGEGLIGLTRGFMYAGVPRVVATLWKVDDAATRSLMALFYQKMIRQNLKPAAALRAAQVEMMSQNNRQAPFFWGAFVIQGDWR
jgi:CHAT domain-containing protein/tetratricopeptide (TPR) repeat protein